MKSGKYKKREKYKEKYWAGCYVLVQNGPWIKEEDEDGNEVLKEQKWVQRNGSVVYWSNESEEDAKAGLQKRMKEKNFKPDPSRVFEGY